MITRETISKMVLDVIGMEFRVCGDWWNYKGVSNPYSRIYLITEGEAFVTHHGQPYALRPGTLHLLPAYTRVDMNCPKQFSVYYIHFVSHILGGLNLFSLLDCDYQVEASPREEVAFQRLIELNPNTRPKNDVSHVAMPALSDVPSGRIKPGAIATCVETDALLRQLLVPFLRTAKEVSVAQVAGMKRFEPVLRWIEANLVQQITLAQLAKEAQLNPTYFSDQFTLAMGERPILYVNRRRVERAQSLLLTTDHSINAIALKTGFPDPAYFSRVFQKICGQSPRAHRKENCVKQF